MNEPWVWDKSHLVMVNNSFSTFLDLICWYFICRFLYLCSWEVLVYAFLSSKCLHLVLILWWCWPLRMSWEVFPLLLSPEIVKNWYTFFPKWLVEFTSEPTWAWCFFLGWLSIIYSFIIYRLIQIIYFFLCWVLADFVFQGIGPFH